MEYDTLYKVFFFSSNLSSMLVCNPNKALYNVPVETDLKVTRGPFLELQENHLHLILYFLTPVLSRTPYFYGKPDNADSN